MPNVTITTTTVILAAIVSIFDKLPGQAYDGTNDRLVKAHQIKVTNNEGLAKICDVVDLRLAAGDDWHTIEEEGLVVEGTDGPLDNFKAMYWVLDGLHNGAGYSWEEVKASLVNEEEAWI